MVKRVFRKIIQQRWDEQKSICVGLDTDLGSSRFPVVARRNSIKETLLAFNCPVIDATKDLVCAYKLNLAFYEGWGTAGIAALVQTAAYIKTVAPEVLIVGDGKRGDIDNTNLGYVRFLFDICGFDAVTLNPFMGRRSLEPFLARKDKGLFILCRTSNKGADEFQNLSVTIDRGAVPGINCAHFTFYQYIAHQVGSQWNKNNNCGLVVAATAPQELAEARQIVGNDMPILIPGVGTQGGDIASTVKAGKNNRRQGMIINSSRATIFASRGPDFVEAARRQVIALQEEVRKCLNTS